MAKFLLIYKSDGSGADHMAQMTPEQGEAMTKMWVDWGNKAGSALIDFGDPTMPVSPGADPTVGGYSLLEADSFDALAPLLTDHPHILSGGSIDTYQLMHIPGM